MQERLPTLDLHGFRVDDVDDRVDAFICRHNEMGTPRIRLMTGKGTGKVKEQVIKYLKMAHYPWQYEKVGKGQSNEGVLVVFLE